jgi:hypothetical protein
MTHFSVCFSFAVPKVKIEAFSSAYWNEIQVLELRFKRG